MTAVRALRSAPDDQRMIRRIAEGDLAALGELFDLHAGVVRGLAARLGVQRAELDDLVQAVFLDVPKAALRHDGRPVRPWILGMTAIAVRRHRRSLRRWIENLAGRAFEERKPLPDTPEQELGREEEHRRFQHALDRLPTKKREVFVMVVLEEMRGEEVAELLSIPVATVWTRLHHARKQLRTFLGDKRGAP